MSASQAELSRVLVQDLYGQSPAETIRALFLYGRLSLASIIKRTGLPLLSTKRALAVLIQNRFVLHCTDLKKNTTVYEANWSEIYPIIRNGALLAWIHRNGVPNCDKKIAADILKTLSLNGHMRVSDYVEAMGSKLEANGKVLSTSLGSLLRSRYLEIVEVGDFIPREDTYQEIIENQLLTIPRSVTMSESKRMQQATAQAKEEMRKLQSRHDSSQNVLKRAKSSDSSTPSSKRIRLDSTQANEEDAKFTVDPTAVIKVNHHRYVIAQRNVALVDLAKRTIGPTTATVYRHALKLLEPNILRCKDEWVQSSETTILTSQIVRAIDRLIDLSSCLSEGRVPIKNEPIDSIRDNTSSQGGVKDQLQAVRDHLDLLTDSRYKFITYVSDRGGGEWFVDYNRLSDILRQITYDEMIASKYEPLASRILRIIRKHGKVDEKMLGQMALIPARTMRTFLTSLQKLGCLELQEVPKSLDRAPARTLFFWFHSPDKAYKTMVEDIYKAESKVLERIEAERDRLPILMSKLQRQDVKNNEELLSSSERQQLNALRKAEDKLLVQLARLDRLVMIFNEF